MFKISHVEVQGSYHKANDTPCQDKTAYFKKNNCACIALADGAGSRRFSHFGAEIAVTTVCDYFADNEFFDEAEFCLEIKTALENSNYLFDDLASTLLFVVVKDNKAIIGHLGDGIIIGVSNGYAEVLSYPENGEKKNITYFTTEKNMNEHFRIRTMDISDFSDFTFILASDGGEALLYDSSTEKIANAATKIADWLSAGEEDEINEALFSNISSIANTNTFDDISIIELKVCSK